MWEQNSVATQIIGTLPAKAERAIGEVSHMSSVDVKISECGGDYSRHYGSRRNDA
jgi:hypothetical protein